MKVNEMGWCVRSLKLKVSVPRGCENAVGEQTERGGRRERGTEMHLQTERHTREGDRVTKKASSRTFFVHTLHLCICLHSRRRTRASGQESRELVGRRGKTETVN